VRREKPVDHWFGASLRFSFALLIVLSFAFSGCKKETPAPKSSPPIPPAAKTAAVPPPATSVKNPAQPPEKTTPVQSVVYSYNPKGRPDPFVPLVLAQERKEAEKGRKGLQVGQLKLSGIVWDKKKEYVALVEAPDGLGYVLKVNDVIGSSARVARITPTSAIFEVKEKPYLAESKVRQVELKLKKEE